MKRLLYLRFLWLLPPIFWAVALGVSLLYNLAALDRHVRELMLAQGRDVYRMVVAMRQWNAKHGGVYVLQSPEAPANPYLTTSKRDLETRSGTKLTLVNPAYMTRQLSQSILDEAKIRVRISSLNPINPANRTESWEQEALLAFERGRHEIAEIVENGSRRSLRYMAPLLTEKSCLECHGQQGYEVGQVRGGISVSFEADAMLAAAAPQRSNLVLLHGFAWLVLSGLGIFALTRIRDLMQGLEAARQAQESLVEQRTAELREEVVERRRAERRLHHLIDSSAQGMLGIDRAGRITFCNRHAQALLSSLLGERQLLGLPLAEVFGSAPDFLKDVGLTLHGAQCEGRLHLIGQDGDPFSLEYLLNPIASDGTVSGGVLSLSDVTTRQQQEEEIWRQAHFDTLTALPNRAMFSHRMASVLQTGDAVGRAAVLFIDLDEFKPVNDRHGHQAGDQVLVEVARRLQEEIRESDFAARIGGDEFVVVLCGAGTSERAAKVAEKLLEALALPVTLADGRKTAVSASIGIAMFPKDGENIETLLRNADLAMYQAKQRQKGSYGFFQPDNHPNLNPHPASDDHSV